MLPVQGSASLPPCLPALLLSFADDLTQREVQGDGGGAPEGVEDLISHLSAGVRGA